jgi:acetyltransferase-like isoleucine patch superfamily enzyme
MSHIRKDKQAETKLVKIEGGGEAVKEEVEQEIIDAPSEVDLRVYIHPTADVSPLANIGPGTKIWHQAQVRERAVLGKQCIIGKGAYVDLDVVVGDCVKIQNRASVYKGVMIESGVFVGPHVCFTNDRFPRAINPDGTLKTEDDWELECTLVCYGASIGAGSIILPGVRIGSFAIVGSGSVVTTDVPDHALVFGNPARLRGYVCRCGRSLKLNKGSVSWNCPACNENYFFKV